MVKYTNEQRMQKVLPKFGVGGTLRALTPIFGRCSRPSRQAITSLVKKNLSSLCDAAVPVRQRVGRSDENIAAVKASVANDPNHSIPGRSQELGIAKTTLWEILRKDPGLHPYMIKLTQELKPMDHLTRRTLFKKKLSSPYWKTLYFVFLYAIVVAITKVPL